METYVMLTKLTDEGRKTLKQNPNRTKDRRSSSHFRSATKTTQLVNGWTDLLYGSLKIGSPRRPQFSLIPPYEARISSTNNRRVSSGAVFAGREDNDVHPERFNGSYELLRSVCRSRFQHIAICLSLVGLPNVVGRA